MADIICRWRNATPKTVCEFVQQLPHEQMSAEDFRLRMGNDFFHTAYQLACQLGLYLEHQDKYIPRFTHTITEDEAKEYLEHWIQYYYAPNPFTKSLKGLVEPVFVVKELVKYLEQHNSSANLKEALTDIFHDPMGNLDIMTNALNNYSKVISVKDGCAKLETNYKDYMKQIPNRNDKEAFFKNFDIKNKKQEIIDNCITSKCRPHITAIKTKPFLLLAGISGTGKSRIVRELARACWDENSAEYNAHKPKNFEMIQVKPNWHDSTELMGYVSRVSGKPVYVIGNFLRFITRAWENPDTPYFLCLDEMNLAPVEQYFAEYLSVIESRKIHEDGTVTTDPIFKKVDEEWYFNLTASLTTAEDIRVRFNEEGICIPQNLIVVGTVNMDETTFSFSRKVLDRAMTIEMNEVDLYAGLDSKYERIGKLNSDMLIGTAVEGVDVYADNEDVCNKVLAYLQAVNDVLNGTPFKVAYRTRNEFLLYVVNNLPYNMDEKGNEFSEDEVIATALDEITSMKILSRIEGDDTKVKHSLLERLITTIEAQLLALTGEDKKIESVSIAKLKEMQERLSSGYTSFWS
ncbi:McrB family protein [Bacteroides fragilis]|uniref:McrB family protein n=1 Tax=Bacteroides fragilis TaxID=817 RepID=UPI002169765E|nr:AAA family ATPase [Bacteroides fragilis]